MTDIAKAYVGAQIHDGEGLHDGYALTLTSDGYFGVSVNTSLPASCEIERLDGGLITPGFVDLQVNGGGGVMFNDSQTVDTLRIIAEAHASTGTAALLPTLITDTPDRTGAAIDAVEQAAAEGVPGIVGIHLEGPHLSVARKGAHDPALIRSMQDEDLQLCLSAAERLPNVMVTVAPENTDMAQIKAMAQAGIIVSLGHTNADFETCMAAFDAGACCVTHLFNAMSQMGNREPGLVGAALMRDDIHAGLIADGVHVHPAMIRIALAAKSDLSKIFLVTDAMATAGSSIESFTLNDREVFRKEGRLTLADGTLAGADLEFSRALEVVTDEAGMDISAAVKAATAIPAGLLRESDGLGRLSGLSRTALYYAEGLSNPRILKPVS